MRNIYSVVIILLFSIPLLAQKQKDINPNGYNMFYYENGKLSSEGMMRDSKPDGYWKTYAESGIIKSEGNRKNFLLDSIWKFYDEKGKIMFEYNYKEGKKCGTKKTFDAKEHYLVTSEMYDKDAKQGKTVNYYKDGKTHIIIPFVAGKEEGQGFELSPDSTIITITNYKMGFVQSEERINRRSADSLKQGMWKTFYPNAVVKTEVNYADNKMNGYLKEYSQRGGLDKMTKYVNGKEKLNAPELAKLDVKTDYYEGGIVKFQGTYKDGVAIGIHREFSKTGKVIAAKVYADGVLTGEGIIDTIGRMQGDWKEFYPGAELKSQGNYDNGKRIGEWVYYYQNGKTEQRGKYDKKGKAQGDWKWYYESGNKWREETYRNNLQDGTMTEYADSGKVITKGEYIDGQKEGPWMLELPDYREEGSYKADKRDGEWREYYTTSGHLRYQGKFVDGVPDGMQKFYYQNGKEKQQGEYQGGNKEGDWYFYDENGFLFLTILFKNDIEVRFDGIRVEPETPLSEPSIK